MTDLDRALVEIRDIRRQVVRATEFRGYGPMTLSVTALIAVLAGVVQAHWLPEPAGHPEQYVALWLSTGIVCAAVIVMQMLTRAHRLHSGMAQEMIWMASAQFLPAALAGAVLPLLLLRCAVAEVWMLPGLWQIIFSLGVFASCRCLPKPMLLVAVWFLLTGFLCLSLGGVRALSPWWMTVPYGIGMTLVAAIHFFFSQKGANDE